MRCVRQLLDDLYWVGGDDHRLALFENIHPIPRGVSYNSYLLLDEKNVLFDTADWAIGRQFLENAENSPQGRLGNCSECSILPGAVDFTALKC